MTLYVLYGSKKRAPRNAGGSKNKKKKHLYLISS